ncbi:hypothetical protein UFOVP755_48 [uncultured Caudovirales phage]|jgi:hypothetical protein|uniref:Uncharacterized protein n=1 Tax=uncultured Caudovirales phage TaxID=2100421 RepID=A0A6J7X8S2_9CAUD|nr:hypothetical protein UFOVP755_48 [uncultured Caudovirales phage]
MQYLKHLSYLDMNTNWLTEQFIIIGKNSYLMKKNGQLKSGLFKTENIKVSKQKDNTYDLFVTVRHSQGNDIVAEYGLPDDELRVMVELYSRHQ